MLYVYYVTDDFETLEQEERYKAVINNKNLKDWNGAYFIGKTKSFISNGKEIIADETMDNFIEYYFKECVGIHRMDEYAEIRINYIETEYSREDALNCLLNDLRYDYSAYKDRIFNSKNMYKETLIILDEIMFIFLDDVTKKLQKRIRELYREIEN